MADRRTGDAQSSSGRNRRASSPDSSESSKASSPAETPAARSQIDFQFLNFSHPSDAKASRARRTVRSHVTKQQHQREHAAQAARRVGVATASSDHFSAPPAMLHARTFPLDPSRVQPVPQPLVLPSRGSPESSSTSPSPSPTHAPTQRIDPADVYPESWHPYVPRTIEYYLNHMTVDIPNLDAASVTAILRRRLFPLVMTDAASLHAVLLLAASQYGRAHGPRSHAIDLLRLRGMAIREINQALTHPTRGTSDQIIVAVAEMATYEALFGNHEIFNTHMTGLTRMVTLRGGLPSLGLDGLIERILLWIDVNVAHANRSRLYFDRAAFPTRELHPRPDPRRFAGGGTSGTGS